MGNGARARERGERRKIIWINSWKSREALLIINRKSSLYIHVCYFLPYLQTNKRERESRRCLEWKWSDAMTYFSRLIGAARGDISFSLVAHSMINQNKNFHVSYLSRSRIAWQTSLEDNREIDIGALRQMSFFSSLDIVDFKMRK